MICVIRLSDCSTSVGIVRADEATGIWAKVLAAEATSAVSTAARATKRVKLVDIKIVVLLDCVACGSSMIWNDYKDSRRRSQISLEVTTRFFRVSIKRLS